MTKTLVFLLISIAIFVPRLSTAATPALFVLGDSTVDVGTNNYINGSSARVDFPYYGIDMFPPRPTGRFSNGLNTADFIARKLGFLRSPQPYLSLVTLKRHLGFLRSPQPYLSLVTLKHHPQRHLFQGVNFASGGSGILDTTGTLVVPLSEQIKQFATVQRYLTVWLGEEQANNLLSKSVVAISVGSNDIFAYFGSNTTVPPEQFLTTLMNTYGTHITALYRLGARKFGVLSVPPVGCVPSWRLFNETGGCMGSMNNFSNAFHSAVQTLFQNLESRLPEIKYSIGNVYEITMDVINNPQQFGFEDVSTACCGTGRLNAQIGCNPEANLCSNRPEYLFWDSFHSTQAASKTEVGILFGGDLRYVSPMNFSQLAMD